jgi:peptide deformylase
MAGLDKAGARHETLSAPDPSGGLGNASPAEDPRAGASRRGAQTGTCPVPGTGHGWNIHAAPGSRPGAITLRPAVTEVKGQVREESEREEKRDPEREARRRTALAQIRQFGDPALRMKANEVTDFDGDLERLVERMTALMAEAQGVGLAATQVGILRRVVVVQPYADEEPFALVNPRLVDTSGERATDDEGCLSMQRVLVPVERHTAVTVEAQGVDGEPVRRELEDLPARVVQHELDHLDGVLILDRTDPQSRREALGLLRPQPFVER